MHSYVTGLRARAHHQELERAAASAGSRISHAVVLAGLSKSYGAVQAVRGD